MGRKKTYVFGSMSNLNTEGEEVRQAIIYGALQGRLYNKFNDLGEYILKSSQLGGAGWPVTCSGVKHRNYILWANNKSFSDYKEPEKYGDTDRTFASLIGLTSPTISMEISLDENQAKNVIENYLGYQLQDEELTNQTVTATGITKDGTLVPIELENVDIKRSWHYRLVISYVGGYDQENLGKAYIFDNGDYYVQEQQWFRYGLISNKNFVAIASGNNASDVDYDEEQDKIDEALDPDYEQTEGEEVALEGDAEDIWLFWGYNTTETHVDEETNEEVVETIFNEEEQEYVELADWVNAKVPGNNNKTVFYILSGYLYPTDTVEGYASEDGYIKVTETTDAHGNKVYEPVRELGAKVNLKFKYSFELEDYQSTYTEEYEVWYNLDNVKFFSLVLNNSEALEDDILGSTTSDVTNESLYMSPPISVKNDGTWLTENNSKNWYWRNWRACKQEYGDEEYFGEVFDGVMESLTDGKIKWVYLMYGIPVNMCQYNYCAHYAIQFFKMLCVPNWQDIELGSGFTYSSGGRSWSFNANSFNFHYQWSISGMIYATGSGLCPAGANTDIYPGAGGCVSYQGQYTCWRQNTPDTWEYVQVSGYTTTFTSIKNGKSYTLASNGWLDKVWETENVKRNCSKNLLPISMTVLKQICIADWTDCVQYIRNVGATAYKVVKKKWYQTGLFKFIMIIIVIIIIVVASYFGGPAGSAASSAAGAGILGAAYTLLWNVLISVAVSAAVAIVCKLILAPILTNLFGDLIGGILTAIVQIVVTYYCIGLTDITDISNTSLLNEFSNPTTWLTLAKAGLEGYSNMLNEKLESINIKNQQLQDTVNRTQSLIASAWQELGVGSALSRTTGTAIMAQNVAQSAVESPEKYFERTLTSGSDIAEKTLYVVEEFPNILLQQRPYSNIA